MQIGFDITSLLFNRGVSRYTSNLIAALAELKQDSLYGFGTSFRQSDYLIELGKKAGLDPSRIVVNRMPLKLQEYAWKWGKQPIHSFLPDIDVFHSWDWLQPPDKLLPLVSTIHDLAILKYKDSAHPSVIAHHEQAWKVLKQKRAQIIAVSHSTKKDIVELLDIPANRISVIHEALPREAMQTAESISETQYGDLQKSLELTRPFILAVGTREPRKNLQKLIQAWKPLAKDFDLIIAGEQGWDATESLSIPQLRFLGKVSNEALSVLYSEAELLAYPSLDEGFGLPILEAFYHGTPVVTSNRSAMPEVAGNAAELVNPDSVTAIRKGLTTILHETEAAQKQRLQKMIIRLQAFSWRKVALETRSVYETAIKEQYL